MVSLDLADQVRVTLLSEGDGIGISVPDHPELETEENLAVRAASWFFRRIGSQPGRLEIEIEKHIPKASGLAGGTADAAAVLVALCARFGLDPAGLDGEALVSDLGSDLPFCLHQGPAWVYGRGDIIESTPQGGGLSICLLEAGKKTSTSAAYLALERKMLGWDEIRSLRREAMAARAKPLSLRGLMTNDFLEVDSSRRLLDSAGSGLQEAGAKAWGLTGSGPTFFGIFSTTTAAESACRAFVRRGFWAVSCRSLEPRMP